MLPIISLLFLFPVIANSQCSPGAVYNEDLKKCYQFYKAAVEFNTAESICSTSNGHLASVHTAIENNFLAKQAQQYIYSDGPVWLGAQSLSAAVKFPQNWRWLDGSPFDYQNYRSGQPSALGTSACMQFLVGSSQWLTASCSNSYPFICSSDPSSTPVAPTCPTQSEFGTIVIPETSDSELEQCPSRYTWFEETNYCYKNVVGFRNFTEANSACQYEGAQLVSIHSESENDFLVELSKTGLNTTDPHLLNHVFIGLIYLNGSWQWTDGSEVDYLNWASGEPNNMNEEFWTSLLADAIRPSYNPTGGQWNNIKTVEQRAYVCKKALN